MKLRDPIYKKTARQLYKIYCGFLVILNFFLKKKNNKVKVYYGGARQGNIGGPLVKVKRLQKYFPERVFGFNVVYLLSNAPYLPSFSLKLLKNNIPIIHNQDGVFYKSWFDGNCKKENKIMSNQYHIADWVFYQSKFCKRISEKFLGKRKGKGEILYNSLDTDIYFPNYKKKKLKENKINFLITGKIGNHLYYVLENSIKGIALARKKGLNAKLTVAGWLESSAKKKCLDLINSEKLKNSVFLKGTYTQSEAPKVYRSADAYIFMNHCAPCPNSVIEALSCGLPVVYSNSGGVSELVGNKAGVPIKCIENWNYPKVPKVEEICDAMLKVYLKHESYSRKARKIAVKNFDIRYWIKRHKIIFKKFMEEKN